MQSANHDYVWRELQELRRKLRGAGNINSTLREWSQGIVGGKSFQTVSEEFAVARPAFRWNHLAGLARVTASEFGYPAPGVDQARKLLSV